MWYREFKDYPPDTSLKKNKVETGHGIVGCEMHEQNGWGESYHRAPPLKKGLLRSLILKLLGQ